MVGRTPEYLGKKIQATEMKMVVLYVLAMPLALLGFAAASVAARLGADDEQPRAARLQRDPLRLHVGGEQQRLGVRRADDGDAVVRHHARRRDADRPLLPDHPGPRHRRFAGTQADVPASEGTFPTHTPLFAGLVVGVVVIVAGLTFFPALALGPIVEQLVAVGARTSVD